MQLAQSLTTGVPRARAALFAGLAIAIVTADQISKTFVDSNFALASTRGDVAGFARPTPIIGDLVRIAKSYNDGGIFGLLDGRAPILAVASLAVIVFLVLYWARSASRSPLLLTLALGLLLGGAIGNLIDRLRFGRVVDFVDMGIGQLRFYTFNVADSAISISIVLLLLLATFGDRFTRRDDASRAHRDDAVDPAPTAAR